MIALMALSFAVLVGIAGLGIDVGFITMQQRSLKNATDAAAIAGAVNMVNSPNQIDPDVRRLLSKHDLPADASVSCDIVNYSNVVVQSGCTNGVPYNGGGVQVTLSYSRPTFFMGILGSPTMNNTASSIARPWTELGYNANASLFAVCGWNTVLNAGGTMNLFANDDLSDPWKIDPNAVGNVFVLHGPTVSTCGLGSNSFKGLTDPATVAVAPFDLPVNAGAIAGPTRITVNGENGCGAAIEANACVMLVPVAGGTPGPGYLTIVKWLPFLITQEASNKHTGILLSEGYVVAHDPAAPVAPWSSGTSGAPVSIRLAN